MSYPRTHVQNSDSVPVSQILLKCQISHSDICCICPYPSLKNLGVYTHVRVSSVRHGYLRQDEIKKSEHQQEGKGV